MEDQIKTKLIIYTFIILFFGMLQIWGTTILCSLGNKKFSFWELLTQYGIYFFASSLVASSWWKHSKLYKNINPLEIVISSLGVFSFMILLSYVYFSGLVYNEGNQKYEFNSTLPHQLIAFCSIICSMSYGIFTEKRTFIARSPITET